MYVWNKIGKNNRITASNSPSWPDQLLVCLSPRKSLFYYLECSYNISIINVVYEPEPRSSVRNTSSHPQVSVLIPRPPSNGMGRIYQRQRNEWDSHPPFPVPASLRNGIIHYHINSSGVLESIISNRYIISMHYHIIIYSLQLSDMMDYCDTDTFHAQCSHGEVVFMQEALYGRMELGTCLTADYLLGCFRWVHTR